jgi:hypothetical protein
VTALAPVAATREVAAAALVLELDEAAGEGE